MRRIGILVLASAFVIGVALADEIKKKDGTVLQGEIVAEDADTVTIKAKHGEAKIPRADIASIEKKALPKKDDPAKAGPKDIAAELEKIKKETAEKLAVLAKEAASQNKKDEAQSLEGLAAGVRTWTLTDLRVEAIKGKATVMALHHKWIELEKSNKDLSIGEKKKIYADYLAELESKKVILAAKVLEVRIFTDRRAKADVTCQIFDEVGVGFRDEAGRARDETSGTIWFLDDDSATRLKSITPGSMIYVEAKLSYDNGSLLYPYKPLIGECKLK